MRDQGDERLERAEKRVRGEAQEDQKNKAQRIEPRAAAEEGAAVQGGVSQDIGSGGIGNGGGISDGGGVGGGDNGNKGVSETEDSEMLEALEIMGLDRQASKWVLGSIKEQGIEGDIVRDKFKQAWDSMKLYGEGKRVVRRHVVGISSMSKVGSMAERVGSIPGYVLDLSVNDPEEMNRGISTRNVRGGRQRL